MEMKYYIVSTDWDNGVEVNIFGNIEDAETFLAKNDALGPNKKADYRVFYGQERKIIPREIIKTVKLV